MAFNEADMPLSKASKIDHTQVNEEEHFIELELEHGVTQNHVQTQEKFLKADLGSRKNQTNQAGT